MSENKKIVIRCIEQSFTMIKIYCYQLMKLKFSKLFKVKVFKILKRNKQFYID